MTFTLTVTAKGRVTLSQDHLQHLGVGPGDRVTIETLPHGKVVIAAARPTDRISDAFGMLKREGGPCLTIDEINEIIAAAWAGKR